jgi:hypothetical protein
MKRYPGVKPFETADRALFFGRDRDIEDMLDLIWLEKLMVLFSKSGYGKSSLINAGLLPEIEHDAIPIVVRFGSYVAGQTAPLENLRHRTEEKLVYNPEAAFIEELPMPKTLWHLFKRKQSPTQKRFVLIFDQFEEFFTYPVAEQQVFKEQIAELLYTEVPQNIRNRFQNDTFSPAQQTLIATPFDAKVLFAIRADRMSFLDSMKDKLPAILHKRYELKGLNPNQARQAIEAPAQLAGDYDSPKFFYSANALRVMTQKLGETKAAQRSGIEAFQLQILCEYLEDKIIKGEIPKNVIEPQYFEDKINDIYEGYYQRLIDKLEPNVQHAAQLLIEEKLIFADEKTGEARRLSVDSGVLMHDASITQSLLNQLESHFLLRREATSTGGFNYEVTHDTMIAPILKTKAERRARELEAELEIEAQKRRRKMLIYMVLVVLSLLLLIWMWTLLREAKKQRNDANLQRDISKAANARYEAAEKKRKILEMEKDSADFIVTLQNVKTILKGTNCPDSETKLRIDTMRTVEWVKVRLKNELKTIDSLADIHHCH